MKVLLSKPVLFSHRRFCACLWEDCEGGGSTPWPPGLGAWNVLTEARTWTLARMNRTPSMRIVSPS